MDCNCVRKNTEGLFRKYKTLWQHTCESPISVKNYIHLGRRPLKFWGARLQPIEPIGKSGTAWISHTELFKGYWLLSLPLSFLSLFFLAFSFFYFFFFHGKGAYTTYPLSPPHASLNPSLTIYVCKPAFVMNTTEIMFTAKQLFDQFIIFVIYCFFFHYQQNQFKNGFTILEWVTYYALTDQYESNALMLIMCELTGFMVSFIGGGNRSTRRKPPTCRKSLTNLIT